MANFKYKTRGSSNPQGKPRVYFCCHSEDFAKYFETISDEILVKQNCSIWYVDDDDTRDEEFFEDLKQMQLFVMPVTTNLLCSQNDALDLEFKFAVENHIPVLPLMQESGLEELFNQKCGDLQFLDKHNADVTAISYDEKLQKYLESVLIGDELADKIRAAFDAYVFLSYRKKDRKYAQELMQLIHKNEFCRDIAIWYDEFLTPGENFNDSIKEALQKSGLFVLTVTPNLVNETNYIMTTEYPMAKREGKPILPTELVPTDRKQLEEKYEGIPLPTDARNESELSEALLESIKKMAIKENDNSPEHNFFIGLAYLGGVDVEVNRARAIELITISAEAGLPEAMEKLIIMYNDGIGVTRSRNVALDWSRRLSEYYFYRIFDDSGRIVDFEMLFDLFKRYDNRHWSEVFKNFMVIVDESYTEESVEELFEYIVTLNISEYTLLFEACAGMPRSGRRAEVLLVTDILEKSVNGIYPPYGPLFWYIPEYALYDIAIITLDGLKKHNDFAKMLALVRDVCFIFGSYNKVDEITHLVNGITLYEEAKKNLFGVRAALCELFCKGETTCENGINVFPRCFNVAEARSFIETGCGIYGVMNEPFTDELGLYTPVSYNELCGEYIGLVSAAYDVQVLEEMLAKRSCAKLNGLVLTPTEDRRMKNIAFNKKHLKVLYIPENIIFDNVDEKWCYESSLIYTIVFQRAYKMTRHDSWERKDQKYLNLEDKMYVREKVIIPRRIDYISVQMLKDCTNIASVFLHDNVKGIEREAFSGCSNLQTIFLPEGLTQIGSMAFKGCINLNSVTIPGTVEYVGEEAFFGCINLSSAQLLNGIKRIFNRAFANCVNLTSISIPSTVTDLIGAFEGCVRLENVCIESSSTRVSDNTFSKCKSLVFVNIPRNTTFVASNLFEDCKALRNIEIPNNVTFIGERSFEGCENLASVFIPDSVTAIGESAFCCCKNLVDLRLSDNLREIRKNAFAGCEKIEKILIPDSVVEISEGAFTKCSQLSTVYISKRTHCDTNAFEDHAEIVFYNTELKDVRISSEVKTIKEKEFQSRREIRSATIAEGIIAIDNYAFDGCINLETAQLPKSITKLGWYSFHDCISLKNIAIPGNVSEIGNWAFAGCENLSTALIDKNTIIGAGAFCGCCNLISIEIPSVQTEIGWKTFEDCKKLKTVDIPDSITKIEGEAFKRCEGLIEVKMSKYITEIGESAFESCINLKTIHIPDTVIKIYGRAFYQCLNIESIFVPDSVVLIGYYAFANCRKMKSIKLPQGLKAIAERAFEGCVSLSSIEIPNSVNKIYEAAFYGCKKLNTVYIPDNVEDVGPLAFAKCTNLKAAHIPKNINKISNGLFLDCLTLKDVNLGTYIAEIGEDAFRNCCEIESVRIPHGVKAIKSRAFKNCRRLESLCLPNGIEEIGEEAFENCAEIKKLEIPLSVRVVGDRAFENCKQLRSISLSYRFENDIERIFGDIEDQIITFI